MNHDQTTNFIQMQIVIVYYYYFFYLIVQTEFVTKYLNFQIIYVCFLIFYIVKFFVYLCWFFFAQFYSRYNNNTIIVYQIVWPIQSVLKMYAKFFMNFHVKIINIVWFGHLEITQKKNLYLPK